MFLCMSFCPKLDGIAIFKKALQVETSAQSNQATLRIAISTSPFQSWAFVYNILVMDICVISEVK